MDNQRTLTRLSWWPVSLLVSSLLGIGVLYYSVARPADLQPIFTDLGLPYDAAWAQFMGGSLPSFVHALGLFLLLGSWLRATDSSRKALMGWCSLSLVVLLTIEVGFGTTTLLDCLAIVLAIPFAFGLLHCIGKTSVAPSKSKPYVPVIALSVFSILGVASYADGYGYQSCARYDDDGNCVERFQSASPIYMSYSELRSSVRQEVVRPMDDVGRIYAFQNYLYINERNRGIHVIDNTDPFDPTPVRFINVPGNLDIEIRGTRLYADSFVDLVTLDIANADTITEVDRKIGVFAWDENQNIPSNIRLNEDEIDRNLGVIIAYEVNR